MTKRCAGDLRHRVTIQQRIAVDDGGGGAAEASWQQFTQAWVGLRPVSARERVHAQHLEHVVTHVATMRYQAGVLAEMRILYGTRELNIRGVINIDERNEWLDLLCEEGVAT